ncbi:MAG: cytoplasmic protein [Candidatus Epulonipiscioides saccharophilum]|nr:MAG: cytoplasmic protein [Epulopiscium sp. AS2M-Bin001]
MENIDERLELIKNRISDKDFLSNKGLSNEVGFHFFCYDPKHEMRIRNYIKNLKYDEKIHIIEYDLYRIFLDILESKRVLKNVASVEEKKGKEYLLTQIQKIATPDAFVEKMKYDNHKFGDVVILSGVGKVFPYMRSHNLLENMQLHFFDVPVVVFYPGEYDGISPKLFGKFIDGHYYRAFNLL